MQQNKKGKAFALPLMSHDVIVLFDCSACLIDNGFVVLIGQHVCCPDDIHPADFCDFLLLRHKIIIACQRKKIDDDLLRIPLGRIGDSLPKCLI